MAPDVIVLNGGSSSGKSSLTRELQAALPGVWLRFSIDTLIEACPPQLLGTGGLDIAEGGTIVVDDEFTAMERCWMAGVAAMARAGAHILIEDGFLSGRSRRSVGAPPLTGSVWSGWASGSTPTWQRNGRPSAGIENPAWPPLRQPASMREKAMRRHP